MILPDPHHNGGAEWTFDGESFFHRSVGTKMWVVAKRAHITPARVLMLAELIEGKTDCPTCGSTLKLTCADCGEGMDL